MNYMAKDDPELLILLPPPASAGILGIANFMWCWRLKPGHSECLASTLPNEPHPLEVILKKGMCLSLGFMFFELAEESLESVH